MSDARNMRRSRDNRAERLTPDEKQAVIHRAGTRSIEFFFERATYAPERGRLICTRARIYGS